MATAKPEQWVSALLTRFEDQLPCRIGPQTHHSRINVQQNKESLIHISKWKFSLVISGLTRTLSRVSLLSYFIFMLLQAQYYLCNLQRVRKYLNLISIKLYFRQQKCVQWPFLISNGIFTSLY